MATHQSSREMLERELTLRLLNGVGQREPVSQRSLAVRLGIALGLTNAYLKRCVRKGWIKIQAAPARRYRYYLTPKGFAEKSKLTAEYLAASFDFFRGARTECLDLLHRCERDGRCRVALVGTGELAEIVTLAALGGAVELTAILAPGCDEARIAGLPVAQDIAGLGAFDALVLTDTRTPQATYDALRRVVGEERILVPPLLNVLRTVQR